jgi:GNAT superfamily N-acetyltransferase
MTVHPAQAHTIVAVTDDLDRNAAWLPRSSRLHRSLRPAIPEPYDAYMRTMFAEGAEMAILHADDLVQSLAVYRCHHTTFHGYRFYVDDLVTGESQRSRGFGAALLNWCEQRARERRCDTFDLESGVQRPRAHQFYFRNGLTIFGFSFSKQL